MYCANCGIKLGDAEERCPLCSTRPGDPIPREMTGPRLYPANRYPKVSVKKGALNGTILFLFAIPLFVTLFIDLQMDGGLSWFWYACGALVLGYITVALPIWFRKPNPVIFVPCDFAAAALYLLLIQQMTGGTWFLPFALPVTAGAGITVTAVIALLRYVRRGRLYIFGGAFLAAGMQAVLLEYLLGPAFGIRFVGWSVYPLIVLAALGGLLIFLAINGVARERMERKLFF